ncbi:hypothetical protein CAPTEDRAFT_34948, partial [Capitella teleta]
SEEFLVQVKAQVMIRDDSKGGWFPMEKGGMSRVGLRKLALHPTNLAQTNSTGMQADLRHEYHIFGTQIVEQTVVLNCILNKNIQYTKATPMFHHWKIDEKRFGLTFQSSADARAFDKGVKRAVEDLLEGMWCSPDGPLNDELGDDEVFMVRGNSPDNSLHTDFPQTLDLPLVGRRESCSQSASTASTTTSSPQSPTPSNLSRPQRAVFQPTSSALLVKDSTYKHSAFRGCAPQGAPYLSHYPYVQFARTRQSVHDYSYPTLDSLGKEQQQRRDSVSSAKKQTLSVQPPLPTKMKKPARQQKGGGQPGRQSLLLAQRSRCVYCHEMFVHEDNQRGRCEDAPDRGAQCIERVSCICCARGMLYHCMADADGDYGHPCVCDSSDEGNCRKWTALGLLSLIVPCLWCYAPLTACHRLGVLCGCCGGKHKAS